MEVTELRFLADLNRGIAMTPLRNAFLTGDQEAHRFIVECIKGRNPVALGGAKVRGYFVRSDHKTIVVEGNAADNRAQVLLPPECYTRPGRFSLLVKVSFGGIVQTVLWAEGTMSRGKTDMIIDPDEVLPNLEELLALVDRLEGQVTNIYIGSDTPPENYNVWIDPAGHAAEDDLPPGKAPYQMIVTGPDGVTRWEERTHYDYRGGTVLPLTDLAVLGGYATFQEPFDTLPQAGTPYKVTYLGFEYECTGIASEADGKPCVVIGNESHMGSGLNTQEPFIFVFYNPEDVTDGIYGWFSCLATNKPTIPVSIVGNGELKKIDKKFLPDATGVVLTAPNGTRYKLTVADDGTLTATAV